MGVLEMSCKNYFAVLILCFSMLLSDCANAEINGEDKSVQFVSLETEKYLVDTEYEISNSEQPIMIYFPAITNKMITNTELGGVAARLHLSDGSVKVTLKPEKQEILNEEYNGYYISFLKYQVQIDNAVTMQNNDSVDLCDTKLWIYHNLEYETIDFENIYLHITFVADGRNVKEPDWDMVINNMKDNMKRNLI